LKVTLNTNQSILLQCVKVDQSIHRMLSVIKVINVIKNILICLQTWRDKYITKILLKVALITNQSIFLQCVRKISWKFEGKMLHQFSEQRRKFEEKSI